MSDAAFVLIAQGHNVPMRIKLTDIRVPDKMIGHHVFLQSVQEKTHALLITPDVGPTPEAIALRQEPLLIAVAHHAVVTVVFLPQPVAEAANFSRNK